jgi:hypothetical protein
MTSKEETPVEEEVEEESGGDGDGFEMGDVAVAAAPPQQDDGDEDKNESNKPTKDAASSSMNNINNRKSKSKSLLYTPPSFEKVGWFRQLSCVLHKNTLLLSRRPMSLLCMLMSSIASVLLAYARGKDNNDDSFEGSRFNATQLTQCGTISNTYTENSYNDVPLTLNEKWRNGFAVALMGKSYQLFPVAAHSFRAFVDILNRHA